jgi:hypothetical protein
MKNNLKLKKNWRVIILKKDRDGKEWNYLVVLEICQINYNFWQFSISNETN